MCAQTNYSLHIMGLGFSLLAFEDKPKKYKKWQNALFYLIHRMSFQSCIQRHMSHVSPRVPLRPRLLLSASSARPLLDNLTTKHTTHAELRLWHHWDLHRRETAHCCSGNPSWLNAGFVQFARHFVQFLSFKMSLWSKGTRIACGAHTID